MKQLFLGIIISLNLISYSQNNPKEALFKIDNNSYYTDEFARVYKKNLDLVKDESQKDLDKYLDLYIGYKLKINKAEKLGLQNGDSYKKELDTYRNQLAKNYLSDSKVTNELVQEGYNRYLKEVKASHILITVDENAAPEDTLKAYNKITEIRAKAVKGDNFEDLAVQNSQDPSAKENKGNLGYFSAFRMIYPFESAAFTTPVGQISKIVRTRFGYHIIKVNDIRDNRGEISVAHIMIMNPEKAEEAPQAKEKIDDIYKKLNQGESFESLAKQFSEDKSSAGKGGELNKFASGQISSEEFENAAFSLKNKGDISAPFQSKYGWHIVKLIEKFPAKKFDDMKTELEDKVAKDDRSRLITNSLTEKLRKKYTIKRNDKLYKGLVATLTDSVYAAKWKAPKELKIGKEKLFNIEKTDITGDNYLQYLETNQKNMPKIKPLSKWSDLAYGKFVDEQMNTYYKANLENDFPDFANVMSEYRDGLLLFDLMDKEIWEKSKTDTIGLKNFYNERKSNYMWKNRYDVNILSSTNQKTIKSAEKMLKSGMKIEDIKAKLNTKDKVDLMVNSGVFEEGNEALPKNVELNKVGYSDLVKDGEHYFVTKINKVLPAESKTLDECKGKVINDYQQFLESNWVDNLKKEFTISVDKNVFEKVKSQLKK